jgi:hypothetical protein
MKNCVVVPPLHVVVMQSSRRSTCISQRMRLISDFQSFHGVRRSTLTAERFREPTATEGDGAGGSKIYSKRLEVGHDPLSGATGEKEQPRKITISDVTHDLFGLKKLLVRL